MARWRLSRIGLRLLAFNLLVVFVPVVGVLYLNVYEARLLQVQERGMVQQGRVLAAALGASDTLDPAAIEQLFTRLERRSEARYRVYDSRGHLLVDSARSAPVVTPEDHGRYGASEYDHTRNRFLYRLGAAIVNARESAVTTVRSWLTRSSKVAPFSDQPDTASDELQAALAGRYGAAARRTAGQRSITLHSALPVRHGATVVGAVVVSQSTFRILQALYETRLRIFEIVIASLGAAALLTAIAAMTIVKPLGRLREKASALSERRGPLPSGFPGLSRKDELGALARALDELTRRANDHVQLLQSFAADVSHELKNPLASIRTAAEMMADADSEVDRRRFLDLMTKDVARLERLVSGLRDVAAVEGQIEQEPAGPVDLNDLLREITAKHQMADPTRVKLSSGGDQRSVVTGSRERLAQVFDNIIANAVSFSTDGVEITVTTREGSCIVYVDDRGPGIPEAHLQRIFDRFFTYRPSQGRREHVGLGLAIAKQIIDSYGGEISASNRTSGGARIEVRLPALTSQSVKERVGRASAAQSAT
jgi:two-component system sensor histidine kinase ChvG